MKKLIVLALLACFFHQNADAFRPQKPFKADISFSLAVTGAVNGTAFQDRFCDTIWSDSRRRFEMRRSHPDNKWIVTRKDDYGYNDQKYSFELKAERCDKDVDGALKYPWLVTVEGSRTENSDYSMTYSVPAPMKVRWGNMLTFSSEDIMPQGKLLVSFYKEGKKTDWITACYGADGTSYETSLNK